MPSSEEALQIKAQLDGEPRSRHYPSTGCRRVALERLMDDLIAEARRKDKEVRGEVYSEGEEPAESPPTETS